MRTCRDCRVRLFRCGGCNAWRCKCRPLHYESAVHYDEMGVPYKQSIDETWVAWQQRLDVAERQRIRRLNMRRYLAFKGEPQ